MQANRSRDTKPEKDLRRALHRMGLRYRVATRPIPGLRRTADIVFRRAKVAVFVDGCFWHGCQEHRATPKSNTEFWAEKLSGNVLRDKQTTAILEANGWTEVRVWEHDDLHEAASRIAQVVRGKGLKVACERS